jgi:GTP-binding protein
MAFTVAIVGRPNVGKSTLFNRLVGRRTALVHDAPGLTRDRREGMGKLGDLSFRLIDTAGLEEGREGALVTRMREQTERALRDADVALLLIDAREGITPQDRHFAQWIRKSAARTILVANKCEGRKAEEGFYDAYTLGLGEPVPISAEHGQGLGDLYTAIAERVDTEAPQEDVLVPSDRVEIAIVGRPNVGKSTLANRLIGEERLLTGPEPGVTRDAIAVDWSYDGRSLRLVDTAGIRRRTRVSDDLEALAVQDSERAIGRAAVVVLVIDAEAMLHRHDLRIAEMAIDAGRAFVIAANKWDVVQDRREALGRLRDRIETSLPQIRGVAAVPISAVTGEGIDRMMSAIFEAHARWCRELATPALNRWLREAIETHSPPMVGGRRLKFRYMTQTSARPPTFTVFSNMPGKVPESYTRYLMNSLRAAFDLDGVPLRLHLRKTQNPYVDS